MTRDSVAQLSGRKWRRSQPASGRVAGVVGRARPRHAIASVSSRMVRTRVAAYHQCEQRCRATALCSLFQQSPGSAGGNTDSGAICHQDERSIRRRHSGVTPNAAIAAIELYDGEVRRMCRSGGREAERQHADCESKSLHCTPMLRLLPPAQLLAGGSTRHELPDERFAPMRPHRVVFL